MGDAAAVGAANAAQTQANVKLQVQTNLLRTSLDQQQSNISQLLEGLPQTGSSNLAGGAVNASGSLASSDPSAGAANPSENVGSRFNVSV